MAENLTVFFSCLLSVSVRSTSYIARTSSYFCSKGYSTTGKRTPYGSAVE